MCCMWSHGFYPTALNGCWGIVFTHGVWMVGRAGVRAGGWASWSWSDLDLTFDLAVVTLSLKILSGLYLGNCKV